MSLLPTTTQDVTADVVQSTRFSMLSGLISQVKENAAQTFKEAKPWGELFDRTAFSKPANTAEATTRLRQNTNYFRTNYLIVATGTTALVMFMNPWSLIVLACLALLWFYMYIIKTTPLVIGSKEFSEREKFIALAGGSLVIVFFLTSVGSIIFYALGLSMLLIGAHAMMHIPDDSMMFVEDIPAGGASTGGIFSFFGNRANNNIFGAQPVTA